VAWLVLPVLLSDLSAPPAAAVVRFESGSMPYAQHHYPFENRERFEAAFPAVSGPRIAPQVSFGPQRTFSCATRQDFVGEGLDQTRGWFYTLVVLGTCLFDQAPFQNVIVNGLVLAEDGKKMSKSLKNYPDPDMLLSKYGADALRLYLISSPVVRAEPLRFTEDDVHGMIKRTFLPWVNAFRFFQQSAARYADEQGSPFVPSLEAARASDNVMDVWMQSSLQGLVRFVREEMAAYRLYTVAPRLEEFVEQLTNWYVRLNRGRLKGLEGRDQALAGLSTLYEVLLTMSVTMAPFAPFLTEYLYQSLRQLHPDAANEAAGPEALGRAASVHFVMMPEYDPGWVDEAAMEQMATLREVVLAGRAVRERRNISLKTPVREVLVVCRDGARLERLRAVLPYARVELNAWEVTLKEQEQEWCVLRPQLNLRLLGKRLGKALNGVKAAMEALPQEALWEFKETGRLEVGGVLLEGEDLLLKKEFSGDGGVYQAEASADGSLLVVLDVTQDEALLQQAAAREVCNRVQKLRKAAGLGLADEVTVYVRADEALMRALQANEALVVGALRVMPRPAELMPDGTESLGTDTFDTALGDQATVVLMRAAPCVDEGAYGRKGADRDLVGV
jgi:isoleucyl-tRNA synthetase